MFARLLVIILGPPGAGKTTVAREIAQRLSLPLLAKDNIKEILFDTLGWSDRQWSRKLGIATVQILFHVLEQSLQAKQSIIVECNFRNEFDRARFLALQRQYDFKTVQVLCEADQEVLLDRFRRRALFGDRHPGHVDHTTVSELTPTILQEQCKALDIAGHVLRVDTTDFAAVDFEQIVSVVSEIAAGHRVDDVAAP